MEAVVSCPNCGLRARLPGSYRGGQLACPKCKNSFTPPAPDGESEFSVWVGDPSAIAAPPQAMMPDPEDSAAHLQWLREETGRFNEFIAASLAMIEKRRHELVAIESRAEALYLPREQELNRQLAAVAARNERLAAREAELAEREAAVERANEQFAPREAELQAREDRLFGTEARIAELEQRQAELQTLVADLEARRAEADTFVTTIAGQRANILRREAELDRAEQALARRLAEVDEIEQQLRQELEEQERDLAIRRRELAQRPVPPTPVPASGPTGSRLLHPY
jgi:DNA repair exonuclease SbcCD ATPase subunit